MIQRIVSPALAGPLLLGAIFSAACYAENDAKIGEAAEYCSSSKLYATNIRTSCSQLGATGMGALYKKSEFINGLKSANETSEDTPSPTPDVRVMSATEQSS